MGFLVFILLLFQTPIHADAVIWDYPLTEQPPGWTAEYGWTFGSSGMSCHVFCEGGWDAEQSEVMTTYFPIPIGTDSLTISINQSLTGSWSDGWATSEIWYRTDEPDSSWVILWSLMFYGTTEDPILFSITDLSPPTSGQFLFRGVTVAMGGMSSYAVLDWSLSDLLLTARGNIQALEPHTWAAIKALGYSQQ